MLRGNQASVRNTAASRTHSGRQASRATKTPNANAMTPADLDEVRKLIAASPALAAFLSEVRLCADLAGVAGHVMRKLDLYCPAEHERHLRAAKLLLDACK